MKHIKKFENSDPEIGRGGLPIQRTPAMEDISKAYSEIRHDGRDTSIKGDKNLSTDFEQKAEGYAKIILSSPEYIALVEIAKDMQIGDSVEMQIGEQGPREKIKNFMNTFMSFFPSFVNPENEYVRSKAIFSNTVNFVSFFRYLISKLQKPGYKL